LATACQPCIAWISNRLGHDGGVDNRHLEAFRRNDTGVLTQGNAHFEKLSGSVFTNAMLEPHLISHQQIAGLLTAPIR